MAQKVISQIVLVGIFLLIIGLAVTVRPVIAQNTPDYYVTIKPITPDAQMYVPAGMNWTISFEAAWTYGEESGTTITNAIINVQVNSSKNEVIDTLTVNSTKGLFSFNYSSSTADVLTFTPIKLVTTDGTEYDASVFDETNSVYGFQSKSVVVWWDTFHISLVSYDTDVADITTVSVYVTYLLLPEEGLTLPEGATYSHQTFLPKTVHDANVTINGVKAEQSYTEDVFTANVSTWLPTAYILVEVEQEGWITTRTAFSFAHNVNRSSWDYAALFVVVIVVAIFFFVFVRSKQEGSKFLSIKNYPHLGGVLIAVTSITSIYWGLVGLDSTLHGFDWMLLTIFGLLSFALGIMGTLWSLRMKKQQLVVTIISMILVVNVIAVKSSLDMYELASPWLMLIGSLLLSSFSGILVIKTEKEIEAPH